MGLFFWPLSLTWTCFLATMLLVKEGFALVRFPIERFCSLEGDGVLHSGWVIHREPGNRPAQGPWRSTMHLTTGRSPEERIGIPRPSWPSSLCWRQPRSHLSHCKTLASIVHIRGGLGGSHSHLLSSRTTLGSISFTPL